jgi:hypothetical protein
MSTKSISNNPISFEKYSKKLLTCNKKVPGKAVLCQMANYMRKSRQENLLPKFCEDVFVLAENLDKKGKSEISGIIYSFLSKISKDMENHVQYLKKALVFSKKDNDPIHVNARLSDLLIATKNNKNEYLRMLTEKETALNNIINDYENAGQSFKNCSKKEIMPLEHYQRTLAFVKIRIANLLIEAGRTQQAGKKLKRANKILEKLGDSDNYEFTLRMLNDISKSKNMKSQSKKF